MNGVREIVKNEYKIFYIMFLSDELKQCIRDWLSKICFIESADSNARPAYSYKNALKHFIHLYDAVNLKNKTKTENRKKGLVGELLVHVLLLEYYKDYSVNSAFFNLEEHSYKKGFDVVLSNKLTNEIWILENKSGELLKNKNADETIKNLMTVGKKDLKDRISENNDLLWQNAVHHAKVYLNDLNSEKQAVVKLLEDNADLAVEKKLKCSDINVMISGVLFHDTSALFSEDAIKKKAEDYIKKNEFKAIHLIAFQKNTYSAIVDFLRSEQGP